MKNLRLYTSPVVIMLIDKALSSEKPNGHWFEADWLHCKRDALSSNRKIDGSRLTGSTQACHSWYGSKNTGDGIASARNLKMGPLWWYGSQVKDPSLSQGCNPYKKEDYSFWQKDYHAKEIKIGAPSITFKK